MHLDIRTLTFNLLLFSTVFAVGMMMVRRSQPEIRGMGWWAAGQAIGGAGFMLLSLRGLIPDFFTIILANDLLLVGLACFYEGIVRFRGSRRRFAYLAPALLVLQTLLFLHYTYAAPNIGARIVTVTVLSSVLAIVSARALVKDIPPRLRPSHWFTAAAYIQVAAAGIGRAIYTLAQPQEADMMALGQIHALSFLSIFFLLVVSAFGCIWMITARLAIDLERQARTDPLTGTMNRRALEEMGVRELDRARRNGRPLSLLMFDLDNFKQLNDLAGHPHGDAALLAVAAAARESLRSSDVLARYGGEEFAVVLPDADKICAAETAERLRQKIIALGFDRGNDLPLTASFGVAVFPEDGAGLEALVARADAALYAAKQAGRNRVSVAGQP